MGQQDLLLTVKKNQRRLYRQIASQFRGHRHFPFEISDFDASNGRQVRWTLRASNATGAIRERWAGASWIIELVSTGRRDGKPFHNIHIFITTLRTSPKALLRLVRQPWAIENQWHWPRDTKLGEDAHRYSKHNGVQMLALLRTLALNLLRCNGFRSIRAGLMAVAHDISRMLGWVGIRATETG
ncbi:MAG: ISAs1 family transposase [Cyanobacteria bacterium REEB417]|nr:ISAs1 family transposase [Cyanobacteria bacterium REEB417]